MLWTSYGLCQRHPFIQGTSPCSVLSYYDIRDRSRTNGEALFPVDCCARAQVWEPAELRCGSQPSRSRARDMDKKFRPHFPYLRNGDNLFLYSG